MPSYPNPKPPLSSYDIVIIGSGAGGGTAAFQLTNAGANVCLLEAGGYFDPADPKFITQMKWPYESSRRGTNTVRAFGDFEAAWGGWQVEGEPDGFFLPPPKPRLHEMLITKTDYDIAYPAKANPEFSAGVAFFSRMRNLTATGYFTSKAGIADIGYMGNTPHQWAGPPQDVLEEFGLRFDSDVHYADMA